MMVQFASISSKWTPVRQDFLPFSQPDIGSAEIAEVVDTLHSGWITTGPKTKRFEQEFTAFTGTPAALALSSCTAALHTALVVAGIGPGDEVITSSLFYGLNDGSSDETVGNLQVTCDPGCQT